MKECCLTFQEKTFWRWFTEQPTQGTGAEVLQCAGMGLKEKWEEETMKRKLASHLPMLTVPLGDGLDQVVGTDHYGTGWSIRFLNYVPGKHFIQSIGRNETLGLAPSYFKDLWKTERTCLFGDPHQLWGTWMQSPSHVALPPPLSFSWFLSYIWFSCVCRGLGEGDGVGLNKSHFKI